MTKPTFRYMVSSPDGDIPLENSSLDYPLEGDPSKTTYRAYFDGVTAFLQHDNFAPLRTAFTHVFGQDDEAMPVEIIVRAEKHGALSHPASIECAFGQTRRIFGLHVATTETGKRSLEREFSLLRMLRRQFPHPYIPDAYSIGESHSMAFLLEEWFVGYHEFHYSKTENGSPCLQLWEYGHGNRFLSRDDAYEIYRQAARILTLYYDPIGYRIIYPWHHAAGDFVVKIGREDGAEEDSIDVKLTTVRGYEPFMPDGGDKMINPVLSLYYFFLHLSIQTRLDKIDGVGNPVWADALSVDATLRGFLEGIAGNARCRQYCGSEQSFLGLLKSFAREDIRRTLTPIAEQFEHTVDYPLIREHFREHVDTLYTTIRTCPE